jgi:hypothetical protein
VDRAAVKPAGDGSSLDEDEASVARKVAWLREAAADRFEHLELANQVAAVDDRRGAAEYCGAKVALR